MQWGPITRSARCPRGAEQNVARAKTAQPTQAKSRSKAAVKAPGMSDDAVMAKTGKTWADWFRLLDKAGAAELPHKEIAILLHERHGLSSWWSQMVTVGYERGRLGRAVHEKAGGFEISATKTVAVPLKALCAMWEDPKRRKRWLPDPLTVTKATANKSIRARWHDDTRISVEFLSKGAGKSLVAVQHGKLKDAKAAARMKAHWAEVLARMKAELEKS